MKLEKINFAGHEEGYYRLPADASPINEGLYLLKEESENIIEGIFLTWAGETLVGDDHIVVVEKLLSFHIGIPDLRECRHTYWGESGYINYPEFDKIKTAIDWLEKHNMDNK